MKKTLIALFFVMTAVTFAFANGNSEKLTDIDGTVVLCTDESGKTLLMLQNATLAEPIQLTEQDRLQIKACETEQTVLQTKVQTKVQTQTRTQTHTAVSNGSGSGSGRVSGSGRKNK